MNNRQFILLFLFSLGFYYAQKPVFTKAKVKMVNVYRNSAELQNSATVNIAAGMNEIVIGNVSEDIDTNSLQIGTNNVGITILSSQFTDNYTSDFKLDTTNPVIKKVSDSIKIVESLVSKNSIETEANSKAIELLDKNQTVLVGSNTSSVAQLTQLTEFYTNKRIELKNKLVGLAEKGSKLQKTLDRLKNSLKTKEEKEADEYASGVLVLKISSAASGLVKFDFNYLASNASWRPYYEIKGNKISEPLDVTLKAMVKQDTGLDWKGVKLSLINGNSNRNNTAPQLQPWFLYSYDNSKADDRGYLSGKAAGLNVSNAEYTSNVSVESVAVTSSTAGFTTNSNELNISYDVDIPYDVLSNNEDHAINLNKIKLPASFQYFSAPNLVKDAFLVAKVENFSKYGLITAPAKIIFENMYIGETTINPDLTEDTLDITLGNDRRISIQRENIKEKSGEKFLSAYREKTVTYDMILKNNKKDAINIEVKDRFPISNNEAVKVELLEDSGAKVDTEKGYLTWNLKLSPSETKKLRISYKVRSPKELTISNF